MGIRRIEAREIDIIGMSICLMSFIPGSMINLSFTSSHRYTRYYQEDLGDRGGWSSIYISIDARPCASGKYFSYTRLIVLSQIDSIDSDFVLATGTPETGGWSAREPRPIIRGLKGFTSS